MRFLLILALVAFTYAGTFFSTTPDDRVPGEHWMQYTSPEEAGFDAERLAEAQAYYDSVGTAAAAMIIYDGAVVAAWGNIERRFMCHSVRKSFMNALYGIYVGDGVIDMDKTLAEVGITDNDTLQALELQATIRDLMMARSGIFHPAAYETPAMRNLRPARGSHKPGTFWFYNNWDFNTLLTIFEEETNEGFFEAFARRLAEPLQMQDFRLSDTYYHLEAHHSQHPAYPFRMSARDMARIGLLYARGGVWGEDTLIPRTWVDLSTQQHTENVDPYEILDGYGYLWWISDGFEGQRMYTAAGVGGQHITVLPDANLIYVQRADTYRGQGVRESDRYEIIRRILAAQTAEPSANPRLRPLPNRPLVVQPVAVSEDILTRYTGAYSAPGLGNVTLRMNDDNFILHGDQFGTFHLLPTSDSTFFMEDFEVDILMRLTANQPGTVTIETNGNPFPTRFIFHHGNP